MAESPIEQNKILKRMLERLHATQASGPLLSCRPHSSRQRIDLTLLGKLEGPRPEQILPGLLGPDRSVRLTLPRARAAEPDMGNGNGGAAKIKDENQALLAKLRAIAEDAKTYTQDTGAHALFVGYPLLHLPPDARAGAGLSAKRILAPIAFVPVQLTLKMTRPASVVLESIADGSDLVVPNAALLAWVQQATGRQLSQLFADEEGVEPWREIDELVGAVCRALEIETKGAFDRASPLLPTPRSDGEDAKQPTVSAAAVLGLFPVSNQGLLSDMEALSAGEPVEGPIRSFLTSRSELGLGSQEAAVQHHIAAERCVGAADPCQLRAVRLARRASGLVIHGPPGTGKSQTITNIITDHLAAGERVLFVCDKRTALDVVHYRLEHLGLGQLCAIVHDARRFRTEILEAQGWHFYRLWAPQLVRDPAAVLAAIVEEARRHETKAKAQPPASDQVATDTLIN